LHTVMAPSRVRVGTYAVGALYPQLTLLPPHPCYFRSRTCCSH
jgi:hypothetical protein